MLKNLTLTTLAIALVTSSSYGEMILTLDDPFEIETKFLRTGPAPENKFQPSEEAGISGMGGIEVGNSGHGGQLITMDPFSIPDGEEQEFSVDFQFMQAEVDTATPLYIGIAALPGYEVGLAETDIPMQNHLMAALFRSGEVPGRSGKIFLQNKVKGKVNNTGYKYGVFSNDGWYRLTLILKREGASFSGSISISILDAQGFPEKVLSQYDFENIENPDLDSEEYYFFVGGQGGMVERGVTQLDNITFPGGE